MKNQKHIWSYLLLILYIFIASLKPSVARATVEQISCKDEFAPSYQCLSHWQSLYREKIKKEGIAYMAGGSLGFAGSLTLSLRSEDPLSKIGYSLMQVLSVAAVGHGASQYFQGDELTDEIERLDRLSTILAKEKLSILDREKILDQAAFAALEAKWKKRKKMRRVRGYLELATAVSAGSSILFAKKNTAASTTAMGFIGFVSLAGAISDLWLGKDEELNPLKKIALDSRPELGAHVTDREQKLILSWRW